MELLKIMQLHFFFNLIKQIFRHRTQILTTLANEENFGNLMAMAIR